MCINFLFYLKIFLTVHWGFKIFFRNSVVYDLRSRKVQSHQLATEKKQLAVPNLQLVISSWIHLYKNSLLVVYEILSAPLISRIITTCLPIREEFTRSLFNFNSQVIFSLLIFLEIFFVNNMRIAVLL